MRISADARELLELAELTKFTLETVEGPFDLPNFPEELTRIDFNHRATGACELLVRFDPSNGFRRFAAAVAALNRN